MLDEILSGIRRTLRYADTVITRKSRVPMAPVAPPEEDGFIDWFNTDVSHGFHVFADDELSDILKYKAETCVYDPSRISTIALYFYQSTSARSIEVDYNKPYHEKLANELEQLQSSGPERQNSLARIRYAAKRIGFGAHKGADGRKVLASDIRLVWRDENGLIKG